MRPLTPPDTLKVGELYATQVNIWLDGVKQGACVEYNRPEGWVERFVRKDGKFVVEGDAIKVERVNGKVEVKWIEEDQA